MRLSTTSALVAILIALPTTQAAQLTYDVYGDTYAFSLEIEPTDPQFETIEFDLTVDAGELVLHGDPNSIEVPGEGGTGFNIWLVGFQWIEARFPFQGFAGTRVRDDRLYQRWFNETGRHARLTEATFIAQAEVSPSAIGQATLRMFRAGEVVGIASTPFGVPEPAAACLAGLCLAGAANAARRNWRHGGGRQHLLRSLNSFPKPRRHSMRRFAVLALLTALVTTRDAWSAELIHELYGDTYAFTLEPDLNDPEIDTFDFDLVVESGALVRPVGDANGITEKGVGGTGFSRLITGPPPFIGPGLSIVGTTATNERLFQAYAKINGPFVDPSSWFSFSGYGAGFIAQAEIEPGTSGTATLRYFRAGEVVGIASTSFGVPEPAAVGLASLAAAGALGVRGRRSSFVAQERPIAYTDSRQLR